MGGQAHSGMGGARRFAWAACCLLASLCGAGCTQDVFAGARSAAVPAAPTGPGAGTAGAGGPGSPGIDTGGGTGNTSGSSASGGRPSAAGGDSAGGAAGAGGLSAADGTGGQPSNDGAPGTGPSDFRAIGLLPRTELTPTVVGAPRVAGYRFGAAGAAAAFEFASGRVTLDLRGVDQLLLAGAPDGTGRLSVDDVILVEIAAGPGQPPLARGYLGQQTVIEDDSGAPVAAIQAPSVAGLLLDPPVINNVLAGYEPMTVDLMVLVPDGLSEIELRVRAVDLGTVHGCGAVWLLPRGS